MAISISSSCYSFGLVYFFTLLYHQVPQQKIFYEMSIGIQNFAKKYTTMASKQSAEKILDIVVVVAAVLFVDLTFCGKFFHNLNKKEIGTIRPK